MDFRTIPGRILVTLLPLFCLVVLRCQNLHQEREPPRLVVMIAIDGLRADLLDRYDRDFTGGFRRLRDEGLRFENAVVDHAITVSHAGHTTLATGCFPSQHGIVDAAFYTPHGDTRALIDAVDDTTESILGAKESTGVSPRQILREGLAEWIVNGGQGAKSLAVGSGYASSLLYSQQRPGDVYWYMRSEGKYVTSTYYQEKYPGWVERFNSGRLPKLMDASAVWECTALPSARKLARADDSPYEADKIHTTFPHIYQKELAEEIFENPEAIRKWFAWTPFLDVATLALATEGVKALSLGQRATTDHLAIVLSQVDNASHYYGPLSLEVFDVLTRIDVELGNFFRFLDEGIGSAKYVLAVSSDHGFSDVPEYRDQTGEGGRRLTKGEIDDLLSEVSALVGDSSAFSESVATQVAAQVKARDFVADAYTPKQLSATNVSTDIFLNLYRNSYRRDRIPRLPLFSLSTFESSIAKAGVMLRLQEGTLIDLDVSNHGSPYLYDRRVPLLFWGRGIGPGVSQDSVSLADVAPSLAQLARIPIPTNIDGHSLFGTHE